MMNVTSHNMPLNVLIVEDSDLDMDLIVHNLKGLSLKQQFHLVDNKKDFMQALQVFKPDIILSDYNMPGFNGLDALEISQEKFPEVPFLFVTGTLGEELAVETLKKGATDFVLKENLKRLPGAVLRALREAAQAVANSEMAQALRESDLSNRALIENAPEAIIVYNPESKQICDFNRKACRLFSCSNTELAKMDFETLCTTEPKSASFAVRVSRALKGENQAFEGYLNLDNNQIKHEIRMVKFPFMGKAMIRVSIIDLSLERKAEIAFLHGQQQERKRIAREIHDGIGQMLVAAKYRVGSLEGASAHKGKLQLSDVEELLEHIIQEARRISNDLSPRVLEELGLKLALDELLKQYRLSFGIDIKRRWDEDIYVRLTNQLNLAVYRIIQEGLNNVAKHAQASKIQITGELLSDHKIMVCITDNGIGFDTANFGSGGNGLKNMQARAKVLFGEFEVNSEKNKGTTIRVILPISESMQNE